MSLFGGNGGRHSPKWYFNLDCLVILDLGNCNLLGLTGHWSLPLCAAYRECRW